MEINWKQKNSWLQDNAMAIAVILLFLLIAAVASFSYMVSDLKTSLGMNKQAQITNSEEKNNAVPTGPANQNETNAGARVEITTDDPKTEEIINRVFKHVFLPSGNLEIHTVQKPDDLRKVNPIFYEYAKVGDYVLVYADRAILYDPVADKVLDIVHNPNPAGAQPK